MQPEGLSASIQRHAAMVYGVCLRILNDAHDAEDAAQAVFLVFARKAPSLPEGAGLSSWFFWTAKTTALTAAQARRRRARREREAAMERAEGPGGREAELWSEVRPCLDLAVAALPARERQATVLRYYCGRTEEEVARELDCERSTVSRMISRALERLRRTLAGQGVAVPAATLGLFLAERTQEQLAPAALASIQAVAAGKAAASAASLGIAEGTMKAMMIAKVKLAAAVVGATLAVGGGGGAVAMKLAAAEPTTAAAAPAKVERQGPLAGLPSAPGPHIEKIKALGDNQWLSLGKAAPDPKWGEGSVRSWGCRMPYAADLGGAFVAGQGPHGYVDRNGYYDDIFFYDLYAHRWICLYPGINTRTFVEDIKKGEIRIGDKGYMVYKDGQPVHAWGHHTYHRLAYDSDRGIFTTAGWSNGVGGDMHIKDSPSHPWYNEGRKLLEEQMKGKNITMQWPPFIYDTRTGKMSREGAGGNFYLPSKKAFWLLWGGKTSLSNVGDVQPKGPIPQVAYPNLCDFPACQDTKRDRIYIGRTNWVAHNGDFYIYDVASNTWSNPPCKGKIEYMPATNNGVVHYDAASDRVLVMSGWCGEGKKVVSVWNPETHEWEAPVDMQAPTGSAVQGLCVTGFYSPEVNAHYLHIGIDGEAGEWWVYRYKKAAEKK